MFETFNLTIEEIINYHSIGLITFEKSYCSMEKALRFYNRVLNDDIVILYCEKDERLEGENIIIKNSEEISSLLNFFMGKISIEDVQTNNTIYWNDLDEKTKIKVLYFQILLIHKF